MPRITKKMKMEELKTKEEKIASLVMMCMGFSVSNTDNIIDEYGTRLVIGDETNRKFLKWGDGPFRYREQKFDPVNNYKLVVTLFGDLIDNNEPDGNTDEDIEETFNFFSDIRTISLRDGQMFDNGKQEKYVELGCRGGTIESERYICPTLGYIELMFAYSGILPENEELLRRVDDLKNELEC